MRGSALNSTVTGPTPASAAPRASCWPRPGNNSSRGFTILEVIVVTVLIAILTATGVSLALNSSGRKLSRAARQLAMHLKLARTLAMTTQRRTWVVFNTSAETYAVYIEDPDDPGRDDRIYAEHPETSGDFTVALDAGDFSGVEIESASFGGSSEVEFDWLGRPCDGSGTLLTADGTAVLSAGGATRTVRVVEQTGSVREE